MTGIIPSYADDNTDSPNYFTEWQEWAYKMFDWYQNKIDNLEKENQNLKDVIQSNNINSQQLTKYNDTISKLQIKIEQLENQNTRITNDNTDITNDKLQYNDTISKLQIKIEQLENQNTRITNDNTRITNENSRLNDKIEDMITAQERSNELTSQKLETTSNNSKIVIKVDKFSEFNDPIASLWYSGFDVYRAKVTIENLSDKDTWLNAYVLQDKRDHQQEWLFADRIDMTNIPPNVIREGYLYVTELDINKNYETVFEESFCYSNCPVILVE